MEQRSLTDDQIQTTFGPDDPETVAVDADDADADTDDADVDADDADS